MKTVRLENRHFINGRMRDVGEIILVDDKFEGRIITKDTDKRNKQQQQDQDKKVKQDGKTK